MRTSCITHLDKLVAYAMIFFTLELRSQEVWVFFFPIVLQIVDTLMEQFIPIRLFIPFKSSFTSLQKRLL